MSPGAAPRADHAAWRSGENPPPPLAAVSGWRCFFPANRDLAHASSGLKARRPPCLRYILLPVSVVTDLGSELPDQGRALATSRRCCSAPLRPFAAAAGPAAPDTRRRPDVLLGVPSGIRSAHGSVWRHGCRRWKGRARYSLNHPIASVAGSDDDAARLLRLSAGGGPSHRPGTCCCSP